MYWIRLNYGKSKYENENKNNYRKVVSHNDFLIHYVVISVNCTCSKFEFVSTDYRLHEWILWDRVGVSVYISAVLVSHVAVEIVVSLLSESPHHQWYHFDKIYTIIISDIVVCIVSISCFNNHNHQMFWTSRFMKGVRIQKHPQLRWSYLRLLHYHYHHTVYSIN